MRALPRRSAEAGKGGPEGGATLCSFAGRFRAGGVAAVRAACGGFRESGFLAGSGGEGISFARRWGDFGVGVSRRRMAVRLAGAGGGPFGVERCGLPRRGEATPPDLGTGGVSGRRTGGPGDGGEVFNLIRVFAQRAASAADIRRRHSSRVARGQPKFRRTWVPRGAPK